MLVLIIILLVLAALMLLPVGVDVAYDEGVSLYVKLGPFRANAIREKAERKPKKLKAEKAKKPEEPKEKKTPPDLKFFLGLAKLGLKALGRFRKKLCVDFFALRYTAAASDPYTAAMQYGYLSIAFATVLEYIKGAFTIEEEDIALELDFEAESPKIFARLILTIQIWQIFYIALAAGAEFLSLYMKLRARRRAKEREREDEHGKRDDQRNDECNNGQDQGDDRRQHRNRRAYHNA